MFGRILVFLSQGKYRFVTKQCLPCFLFVPIPLFRFLCSCSFVPVPFFRFLSPRSFVLGPLFQFLRLHCSVSFVLVIPVPLFWLLWFLCSSRVRLHPEKVRCTKHRVPSLLAQQQRIRRSIKDFLFTALESWCHTIVSISWRGSWKSKSS